MTMPRRSSRPDIVVPRQSNRLGASVLFALEPKGVGTADVEALSSYLHRLAEKHDRRASILLERLILGPAELAYGFKTGPTLLTMGSANGDTFTSRVIAAYLESLTTVTDVRRLTLEGRIGDVWANRAYRKTRAWCPRCLSEDPVPYDRLLWTMRKYRACHVHEVAIAEVCGACHKAYRPFHHRMGVAHCVCGAALAQTATPSKRPDAAEDLLGQLLLRLDQVGPITSQSLQAGLSHHVRAAGSANALGRAIGWHSASVLRVARDGSRAELDELFKALRALNVPLGDFLGHRFDPITRQRTYTRSAPRPSRVTPEILAALEELRALPDSELPRAADLAATYGVSTETLRRVAPAQVKELARRRRNVLKQRRQARVTAMIAALKDEVRAIHARTGKCHWSAIRRELKQPGILRFPEAVTAVEEVRAELLA